MKPAAIPTTVEDLRARWATLHDLDRGKAVKRLNESGNSTRSLAKELGCAESSLRNLLAATRAPAVDRLSAKNGRISTRELVRRSKAAANVAAEKARIAEEERRAKESKKWGTLICSWLQEQNLAWAHQENIIQEVQRELMEADISGTLPEVEVPKGVTLDLIIDRTRPEDTKWEQAIDMYFHVDWLGHWILYAIPDAIVRDAALTYALNRTQRQIVAKTRSVI
jgi:lambda repressor-like predicted transcriptional regulator